MKIMTSSKDLLILYEAEAQQWSAYLRSVFTGHIPQDAIRCYDIAMTLGRYRCKLLVLSRGMVEGEEEGEEGCGGRVLCRTKRFFLSRVLSPAASVVVLLCGVESPAPLLAMVALRGGDRCRVVSSEQEACDYLAAVMRVVRRGGRGGGGGGTPGSGEEPPLAAPDHAPLRRQTSDTKSVVSTSAVNTHSVPNRSSGSQSNTQGNTGSPRAPDIPCGILVVPSRVPCGASGELFVLVRDKVASGDIEVEFRGGGQSVRVRPERWAEHVLLVRPPDLPSGEADVTLYCGGRAVDTAPVQYCSPLDELSRLLTRVADPVQFMCQSLQLSSLEKLDQKLASMVLQGLPSGGLQQDLLPDNNAPETGLLQCPGAQRALRTADRHGMTPAALAHGHGHAQLHGLLKQALVSRHHD
ncbi:hypothetical protein CRUP_037628 [Coryphaenoides rupestris]|nr:hypothetical protein CRUP_037628 [Coryphaenoides rupestris]